MSPVRTAIYLAAFFVCACSQKAQQVSGRNAECSTEDCSANFSLDAPDTAGAGEEFVVSWNYDGDATFELIIAHDEDCASPLISLKVSEKSYTANVHEAGTYYLCAYLIGNSDDERVPFSNNGKLIQIDGDSGSSGSISLVWSSQIGDQATAEDSPFSSTASASPRTATYSFDTDAMSCDDGSWSPSISIDASTGDISGTPTNDDVGSCTIAIRASLGSKSIVQDFTVNITNTNDLPTWSSTLSDSTNEVSVALSGMTAAAIDVDSGSSITYSLDSGSMTCDDGSWTVAPSIDANTGVVSGTPSAGDDGTCTIAVTATSGSDVISQSFTLHVFPAPTAFTFTGDAGDELWTTAGNWHGGTAPGNSDVALFSARCGISCPVQVDQNIDVSGIELHSSFAGTITQNTTRTITIGSGNYTQAAGSFVGGDAGITLSGDFNLSGGSFQATSDTLQVTSDITIASGVTYNHANGNLYIYDSVSVCGGNVSTGTIDIDTSWSIYDFTVRVRDPNVCSGYDEAYQTITSGDTIVVENDFTVVDGYFVNGTIDVKGNIDLQCADGITGDRCANRLGDTAIKLSGTGAQTYTVATDAGTAILEIDKSSGSVTPAAGTTELNVKGFTLTNGAFTAPTGRFLVKGDFTVASGTTFTHNSGLLNVYPTVSHCGGSNLIATIDVATSLDLYDLTLTADDSNSCGDYNDVYLDIASGDTLNVANDFTHNDGTINGGNVVVSGNLISDCADGSSGRSCSQGGTTIVEMTGGAAQTYSFTAGGYLPVLTIDKSSSSLTAAGGTTALSVSELDIQNGTFVGPSSTLVIYGDLTVASGGSFTHNGGTLVYAPNAAACGGYINAGTIDVDTSITLNHLNLDIRDSSSCGGYNSVTATIASGDTVIVTGSLTITDGTIDGGTIEVDGDVAINCADGTSGDNCAYGGTTSLTFAGTSQDYTVAANALELDGDYYVESSSTVTMQSDMTLDAGATITVDGGTVDRNTNTLTGTTNIINGGQIIN